MGPKKESPFQYLALLSQIGISVFVPIALMFFVAKGLNYFFHTGPIVFIICIVLGSLAGLKTLYDLPMRMNKNTMENNRRIQEEYEKNREIEDEKMKEAGEQKNENE